MKKIIITVAIFLLGIAMLNALTTEEWEQFVGDQDLDNLEFQMSDLPDNYDLSQIDNLDDFIKNSNFDKSQLTWNQVKNLDAQDIKKMLQEGNGDYATAGQTSQIVEAYAVNVLGRPDSITINQPGAKIEIGYDDSMQISYGNSGKISIGKLSPSKSLRFETVTNPNTIKIIGKFQSTYLDLSPDTEISFWGEQQGGETYIDIKSPADFPPLDIEGDVVISTEGTTLLVSNKDNTKTVEIRNAISAGNARSTGGFVEVNPIKCFNKNEEIIIELQKGELAADGVSIGIKGQEPTIKAGRGTKGLKFITLPSNEIGIEGEFTSGTQIKVPGQEEYVRITSNEQEQIKITQNKVLTKGGIILESEGYVFKKQRGRKPTQVLMRVKEDDYTSNGNDQMLTKQGQSTLVSGDDLGTGTYATGVVTKTRTLKQDIVNLPEVEGVVFKQNKEDVIRPGQRIIFNNEQYIADEKPYVFVGEDGRKYFLNRDFQNPYSKTEEPDKYNDYKFTQAKLKILTQEIYDNLPKSAEGYSIASIEDTAQENMVLSEELEKKRKALEEFNKLYGN